MFILAYFIEIFLIGLVEILTLISFLKFTPLGNGGLESIPQIVICKLLLSCIFFTIYSVYFYKKRSNNQLTFMEDTLIDKEVDFSKKTLLPLGVKAVIRFIIAVIFSWNLSAFLLVFFGILLS